jgi:hypothetical protein
VRDVFIFIAIVFAAFAGLRWWYVRKGRDVE